MGLEMLVNHFANTVIFLHQKKCMLIITGSCGMCSWLVPLINQVVMPIHTANDC